MDAEHRTGLRFAAEMSGAVLLLAGTTFLRGPLLAHIADPTARAAIGLLPIVPVWLMLLASVRHYFRIDEYQRLKYLQGLALTSAIIVCLTWSYPYAKSVFGLPPLDGEWSVPFAIVWVAVSVVLDNRRVSAA